MIPWRFEKSANVDVGGSTVTAPGSMNMPGAGYGNVAAGSAQIPGMSLHCLSCGKKLKAGMGQCPKCGNAVRPVASTPDNQQAADTLPTTSTETPDRTDTERDLQKNSNLNPSLLKSMAGGAVAVGAGLGAIKLLPKARQFSAQDHQRQLLALAEQGRIPPEAVKMAQRTGPNPILRLREAVKKLREAAGLKASVAFKK